MAALVKARTLLRLGLGNVTRVGLYRVALRAGIHRSQRITATPAQGVFFESYTAGPPMSHLTPRKDWVLGMGCHFGRPVALPETANGDPPDWFKSPGRNARADSETPWWKIPDFSEPLGDIKPVWELSRFDWALVFAQRARGGDCLALDKLNTWLADWASHNVPYRGVNWKCGQEASIRVMHLAMAARILFGDPGPSEMPLTPALRDLLHTHLQRIAPTMAYAIGQSNNHATSEAAALFIGGSFLGGAQGEVWAATGRRWLEERSRALVLADGTFSQYSASYHRLMLDTYCFAETWRRAKNLPEFTPELRTRMAAATDWLEQLTDAETGDGPVLGSNDGAHLIALTDLGYRDFRPSVQMASTLFRGTAAYAPGPWDAQLSWMGIVPAVELTPALKSRSFDDGGLHVLRAGPAVAYLRYPRYKFRPGQADALHCDLWIGGTNILNDAGTYSYNVSDADTAYFNGAEGHNTISFDGRDQMPRLSRFLYGDWLKAEQVKTVHTADDGSVTAAAGYCDAFGARHNRSVLLSHDSVCVTDRLSGFFEKAVLHWRLAPNDWTLEGNVLRGMGITLTLSCSTPLEGIRLTQGEQSRYYLQKSSVPVLEATLRTPGTLTTDIQF